MIEEQMENYLYSSVRLQSKVKQNQDNMVNHRLLSNDLDKERTGKATRQLAFYAPNDTEAFLELIRHVTVNAATMDLRMVRGRNGANGNSCNQSGQEVTTFQFFQNDVFSKLSS